jgi:hypothetical protein
MKKLITHVTQIIFFVILSPLANGFRMTVVCNMTY